MCFDRPESSGTMGGYGGRGPGSSRRRIAGRAGDHPALKVAGRNRVGVTYRVLPWPESRCRHPWTTGSTMQRVNARFIMLLGLSLIAGMAAVIGVHRFNVVRNADSIIRRARERRDEGRSDEAAGMYTRYIALRPTDGPAQAELAMMLLDSVESGKRSRGAILNAYNSLEAAVRKNPQSDALREKLARFLLKANSPAEALQHLKTLRDRRLQRGDPKASAEKELDAVGEVSSDAIIDLLYAQASAGAGDDENASRAAASLIGYNLETKVFDTSFEPLPGCADAYVLLSDLLERRFKDTSSATKVIRRLTDAYPKDAKAWLAMARWSFLNGDPSSAAIEIAKAAELDPASPDVAFTDFEIAMRSGNVARAERLIRETMAPYADDPRVIVGRADVLVAQGDAVAAQAILEAGSQSSPESPPILHRLIDILFDQEKVDAIPARIDQLRELEGDDAPAVLWSDARMMMIRGQWHQAIEALRELRPAVANVASLKNNVDLSLALCHQNLGQGDEVLEAARRVLADDPNSYQARVALATAHTLAGRTDEALAELESLAREQTPDELAAKQLLWGPLLQVRIQDQLRLDPSKRSWVAVDSLVDLLSQSPFVTSAQLASVRSEVLRVKGESNSAIDVAALALEESPKSPMVAGQYLMLLLADNRIEVARETLAKLDPEIRNHPMVLSAAARIAAAAADSSSEAELAAIGTAVESLATKDAVTVLLTLIEIRSTQRRLDEAERIALKILDMEPGELRTHSVLLDLAKAQRDIDKMRRCAEMIGDVAGLASPQARVARALALALQVRLSREKVLGPDLVPPPLSRQETETLEEASRNLVEAENERPGWYQIQQTHAEIAGLRGDTPAAILHLQRAIEQGAPNPDLKKMLGALLLESGRVEEARTVVASTDTDSNIDALRVAAQIDAQSGRFEAAIAAGEKVIGADQQNPDTRLWFARLLADCRRDDLALESFERAVELAPERSDAWLELIRQQLRTGLVRPAEESLARAKEQLKGADRWIVAAATAEMQGRPDEAEAAYRQAVTEAPNDPRVSRQYADHLVRRGRIVPAREELRRLIAMPDAEGTQSLYWARRTLVRNTSRGTDWKDLMAMCGELEKNVDGSGSLTPEDAAVEFAVLMEREEPEAWRRAVSIIDDLARRRPLQADQRVLRAWLLDKLGRWVDARSALVDIAAEEDCSPTVIGTLVEQLIKHGEINSARTWAATLRAKAPDAPMTLRAEAQLAIAAEDREAAADAARKLIPVGPLTEANADFLTEVAQLVEQLGFPKASEKLLTESSEIGIGGVVAKAAFLGRQQRTEEALDTLGRAFGSIPEVQLLATAIEIVENNGVTPSSTADSSLLALCARASRADPDSVMIGLLEAESLVTIGRPEEAIQRYRELLTRPSIAPTMTARCSNNLAHLLAESGELDEARRLVEKSMEQLGPHPIILDTRGVVWLRLGDTARAIEDFSEALLAPSAITRLHMAAARYDARQVSECRSEIAKAEQLGLRTRRLPQADRERLQKLDAALGESAGDAQSAAVGLNASGSR